jgi:hypothetical protein
VAPGRAPGRKGRRFFVGAEAGLKYGLEIVKKNPLDSKNKMVKL